MKTFAKILLILALLTSFAQAITFDVLVLPADIFNTKENYYGLKKFLKSLQMTLSKTLILLMEKLNPQIYTKLEQN